MRALPILLLLLAACQREYGAIAIELPPIAPPNPPNLEPTFVVDALNQGTPKKVDILWVIDNSSSMLAEQEKLTENFPVFMNYYRNSGLDWRIGVISTDMDAETDRGKLQPAAGYRYLDPAVPDPTGVFQQMAILGRGGAAREQGLAAIQAALSEPVVDSVNNDGFYRDEALLSIIVVSDENDFSVNLTPAAFETWVLDLKPDPEMLTFSGIVQIDDVCGPGSEGGKYLEVVEATGGAAYDICDDDWAPILEQLAIRTVGLRREFYLSQAPDLDSMSVWIEDLDERYDFEPELDYVFDQVANSITFTRYTPRPSATVYVAYRRLDDL